MRMIILVGFLLLGTQAAQAVTFTESPKRITLSNGSRTVHVDSMIWEIQSASRKDRRQLLCMAVNVFFEASSIPSSEEMKAISLVVKNRVGQGWGNTPCEVVWQASQFGWTGDRLSTTIQKNQKWLMAQRVAYMVYIDDDLYDPYKHTGFCNPKLDGYQKWCHTGLNQKQINSHLFVRMRK